MGWDSCCKRKYQITLNWGLIVARTLLIWQKCSLKWLINEIFAPRGKLQNSWEFLGAMLSRRVTLFWRASAKRVLWSLLRFSKELPRCCSSVGRAAFEGPSLAQLYWHGFETRLVISLITTRNKEVGKSPSSAISCRYKSTVREKTFL